MHHLGLKSSAEWFDYCKSGKKPDDIPTAAPSTYAKDGWAGMGDWLGTGTSRRLATLRKSSRVRAKPRFEIRKRNGSAIVNQVKSPTIFRIIPMKLTQKRVGLVGAIGSGPATRRGGWQPFEKARAFVRGLGLKSEAEWSAYCKSGKKPADIPATPTSNLFA